MVSGVEGVRRFGKYFQLLNTVGTCALPNYGATPVNKGPSCALTEGENGGRKLLRNQKKLDLEFQKFPPLQGGVQYADGESKDAG